MNQLLIITAVLILLLARNLRTWKAGWTVTIIAITLLGIAEQMDRQDELLERAHYCSMVREHLRDPRYGWPDYRGIYADECRRAGDPAGASAP